MGGPAFETVAEFDARGRVASINGSMSAQPN